MKNISRNRILKGELSNEEIDFIVDLIETANENEKVLNTDSKFIVVENNGIVPITEEEAPYRYVLFELIDGDYIAVDASDTICWKLY